MQHPSAEDLVDVAMAGTPSHRLGVAKVASSNIAYADCQKWCEEKLTILFSDEDRSVRSEAASCFRQLKDLRLEPYEDLIEAFCQSPAYQEAAFSLFYMLEESIYRLPGIICMACEVFLDKYSEDIKGTNTRRAADVYYIPKLIFRTYQQHQYDEWGRKCLDLIDKMCAEGIYDVYSSLNDFER
jgi:hypothetical protein